jgi:hypothetical protein
MFLLLFEPIFVITLCFNRDSVIVWQGITPESQSSLSALHWKIDQQEPRFTQQ